MSDTLAHVIEVMTYMAAAFYAVYSGIHAADIGLTAFLSCTLLACFAGACYSLFRMFTRDVAIAV